MHFYQMNRSSARDIFFVSFSLTFMAGPKTRSSARGFFRLVLSRARSLPLSFWRQIEILCSDQKPAALLEVFSLSFSLVLARSRNTLCTIKRPPALPEMFFSSRSLSLFSSPLFLFLFPLAAARGQQRAVHVARCCRGCGCRGCFFSRVKETEEEDAAEHGDGGGRRGAGKAAAAARSSGERGRIIRVYSARDCAIQQHVSLFLRSRKEMARGGLYFFEVGGGGSSSNKQ